MPQYLWLATGGKSQFNNRLTSLKGRNIIAFPYIDAYHDWLRRTAHIDLADWLVEFLEGKNNAK